MFPAVALIALPGLALVMPTVVAKVYAIIPAGQREAEHKSYLAEREAYYLANRCYGLTVKGVRCSKVDCSISHKNYLDR
jgi:hypothetical protein